MGIDRQRLNEAERANLIAFLDGELNEAEARAIAIKVEASPTVKREIDLFRRTWEFLDALPRPAASQEFAGRTVSLVTQLALKEDQTYKSMGTVLRTLAREAIWFGIVLGLGLVGYAAARWGWPDRSARIDRDLSILENFEGYQEIGTSEYLQELDKSPEFDQVVP